MRGLLFPLLLLACLLATGLSLYQGAGLLAQQRANAEIRAMASGRDQALSEGGDPRRHYARTLWLSQRERLDEALTPYAALADAPPPLRAAAAYALGNARMRAGFERIENGDLDGATPEINLAKAAYREALQADPAHRDARVNLSLAMRLVRDLPRDGADGDEDPEARPRRIWTDLPGLPRGAP